MRRLAALMLWIRSHGETAWIVGDKIVIESHGRTYGYDTTFYDGVRTFDEARVLLGY